MREYIALLKNNRNYRYLWFGQVISLLGDWFNLIASAQLITEFSNSGIAISALFLARFLPLFLFTPFAGVLADRYNRRTIMIVSDLLRAATVLSFLLVRVTHQIWLLYLLTVIQFTLSALFTPARSAILVNVVRERELIAANALDSFTWSTMLALGSLLGGLVAALFGADVAFILDALTFLLSAWVISRVVLPAKAKTAVSHTGWFDFVDGFRYLWYAPFVLAISLVKAAGALLWGGINVLELTFAKTIFPLNDLAWGVGRTIDGMTATLGLIYIISGIGTGLGPLLMRRWLGDRPVRIFFGITLGVVMTTVGIWYMGVAGTLFLFLLATFIRTIGTGTMWVFSSAMLQLLLPERYRGRVFAFELAALTLTQSVSILMAGVAQDRFDLSVQEIARYTGFFGMGMSIVWVIFNVRAHGYVKRTVPSPEGAELN